MPGFLLLRDNFDYWQDFYNFTSGSDGVTSLAADAGSSAAVADGAGGVLTLGSGATLNNEAAVRSTQALWLPANNRPVVAEARLQYAEAATNQANVAFGLADAAGADLLVDGGAGPKVTGTQALIYKVAGGSVWRCQARNGTQVSDSISGTSAGGSNYTTLRVELKDMSTTQATVTYQVDGVPLRDSLSGLQINHQLNYSGALIMRLICYLKAGSATAEGLALDYFGA